MNSLPPHAPHGKPDDGRSHRCGRRLVRLSLEFWAGPLDGERVELDGDQEPAVYADYAEAVSNGLCRDHGGKYTWDGAGFWWCEARP